MSEVKPREFWINFGNSNGTSVRTRSQFEQTTFPRCPDYQADAIHVIEYSSYEKLNSDAFEDTKKLYAQSQEIEKLKAENKKLQNAIDENCNENPYDFSQYCQQLQYNYDLEITKLTHQRDTLKKCAEFYADKNNWLREKDGWRHDMIVKDLDDESLTDWEKRFSGKTARKALQDVEES